MKPFKDDLSLSQVENVLHHLNYRWNMEALALWKGEKAPFEAYKMYDGFDDFISIDTLKRIEKIEDKSVRPRLRHALIDHYLQRAIHPHETEMRTWMRGAAAHVNGTKIYFRDIIPWCQKSSTYEERQILQKETGPLCKFLKPFAMNYWGILLDILSADFGFDSYLDYCGKKKNIDYEYFYEKLLSILQETDDLYFPSMERWCRDHFNLPLKELTRFDAINLLGLGQFDAIFPDKSVEELNSFFDYWEIDLNHTPGLNLSLERDEGKSAQAMCFILQVPEEVYILMKPEGGWVDLETLWHELGHGLSVVFTSPELSIVERDMATSFSLSESFAFLLQNLSMTPPFLEGFMGLKPKDSKKLAYYKMLKDISIFRRYAAKFIAEFEMFSEGDLSDGSRYSELMSKYTGFYYQPESHLFDLVPEFYCLDYVMGWIAEAMLEDFLRAELGDHWMFSKETGTILKKWWKQGNRFEINQFFIENGFGPLDPGPLLAKWDSISKY